MEKKDNFKEEEETLIAVFQARGKTANNLSPFLTLSGKRKVFVIKSEK